MITGDMTVARVLQAHPQLVDVLAGVHPHFELLRKRMLRKMLAPRVTVAQAARMAGVPADELVATLRRAVGGPADEVAAASGPTATVSAAPTATTEPTAGAEEMPASPPRVLDGLRRVDLDVRDDIRGGIEPFSRIMAAVKDLDPGDVLVLRAPFEPVPLYDVLGRRGFARWTEQRAADDWSVWFYAAPAAAAPAVSPGAAVNTPEPGATTVIDVRGLEPPQPMVRVLQRLDVLGADQQLVVLHDRRPLFLYPQLEARGFVHETREPAPGHVEIIIRRAPEPEGGSTG